MLPQKPAEVWDKCSHTLCILPLQEAVPWSWVDWGLHAYSSQQTMHAFIIGKVQWNFRVGRWEGEGCWGEVGPYRRGEDHRSKRFIMVENGCVKLYPTSHVGPEINYLLQGGVSGKGSLLAKPSGLLGTLLAWRTLFRTYLTIGHVLLM